MMNPRTQNIQKQEIVVEHKIENIHYLKYNPELNLGPFNLIKKCLHIKIAVIVKQSLTMKK